jgi:hypothetical protein
MERVSFFDLGLALAHINRLYKVEDLKTCIHIGGTKVFYHCATFSTNNILCHFTIMIIFFNLLKSFSLATLSNLTT